MPKKSLIVSSALEAMLRAASFSALPIAPMPLIKPLIMSLPSCTQSTFLTASQRVRQASPAARMISGEAFPMPCTKLITRLKPAAMMEGRWVTMACSRVAITVAALRMMEGSMASNPCTRLSSICPPDVMICGRSATTCARNALRDADADSIICPAFAVMPCTRLLTRAAPFSMI